MGNSCGGNGNCCGNNDVGDSNINRMAEGVAMMMTMTIAAAAVATACQKPYNLEGVDFNVDSRCNQS